MTAAAHGPSVWWYATRGAGATSLVLLSASVGLGIAEVRAWRGPGASRFAFAALHRSVSLLALALLAVHIVTTVVDPFPAIGAANAVVPFATGYRTLWVGLGTIASDILLAVVVTSLVRRRLGYRAWRAVHWAAYVCWPVAVLHGLGTGSDARTSWMAVLTAACVLGVAAVALARLAGASAAPGGRLAGGAAVVAAVAATAAWAHQGPLAGGWARRAGTPRAVLAAFAAPSAPAAASRPRDALERRFQAGLRGPVHTGPAADGSTVIDLPLRLVGGPRGALRVRLAGTPQPGGGLSVDRSAVALGPAGAPGRYQGRLSTLAGGDMRARVGSADGTVLRLHVRLRIADARATGTLDAAPEAG